MVVALEDCFDQPWEVATLFSRFVDRDAERCEPGEIHQEVVDKIANATVVVISQDVAEGDAVRTAERVVADEGESAAVAVVGETDERHGVVVALYVFYRRDVGAALCPEIDFSFTVLRYSSLMIFSCRLYVATPVSDVIKRMPGISLDAIVAFPWAASTFA